MSTSNNINCPSNAVAESVNLSIPQDITYAVIPGQNVSAAMASCCQPNPVNIVDVCWNWCRIPSNMTNDADAPEVMFSFSSCLDANGHNISQSNGLLIHMASSATPNHSVTLTGLALVAVVALRLLI
ncbi:hypothetical protein DL766_009955 [Monosporascus sp. MC13-8B]|uniref:Uncharacterized protein n=2 Tax=Monosporascus TaxID=155415 RepID=A0A4Q4TCV0_9PEZI|nr:hypothetical protein DL763_011174 [Monosporascus cannonballus]RYO91009.1 hypothetical protein DL762_002440 [Monosporascus cannonballus]RYP03434.1 hypothetical protein DL764_005150 [Monosporascus ibericus]RYP12431.1 hypothetical protein DL766_009955 [Monosporascus sp. MC13-8B]